MEMKPSEQRLCGLWRFRPRWLQRLANTTCYVIVFSLMGVVQGMSFTYSSANFTMIEKRFKIPSRIMSTLTTGMGITHIALSMILAYYGGRGHRPLWLAFGGVLASISAFLMAVPHFIYGPGGEALALTEEYFDASVLNVSHTSNEERHLVCDVGLNSSATCDGKQQSIVGEFSLVPLVLIFISYMLIGVGTLLNVVLAETYIDDHTKRENTPIMLGIILSLRRLGAALGFLFSSLCLSLYVDPTLTPIIGTKDPRWLGAWWLGWVILGAVKLVIAALMAFFPKAIPTSQDKDEVLSPATLEMTSSHCEDRLQEQEPLSPTPPALPADIPLKQVDDDGFFKSLWRTMRNRIVVYNAFSAVFASLVGSGTMVFSLKYLETQFHTSAAGASIISGTALTLGMVISHLVSGVVIDRLRPSPSFILGWNIVVDFLDASRFILYIFLRCESAATLANEVTYQTDFMNECNYNCGCKGMKYQPVCFAERDTTFYSPCHIGCQDTYLDTNISKTFFTNCTCIPDVWGNASSAASSSSFFSSPQRFLEGADLVISNGPCPVSCATSLYIFVISGICIHLLGGFSRIGTTIIDFRCVEQKDKSFTQGFNLFVVWLFGMIPGPVIFGIIIDNACLVWDTSCNSRENCSLYDKTKFLLYFNLTAAALSFMGTFMDYKVWSLGRHLNFYSMNKDRSLSLKKLKRRNSLDNKENS